MPYAVRSLIAFSNHTQDKKSKGKEEELQKMEEEHQKGLQSVMQSLNESLAATLFMDTNISTLNRIFDVKSSGLFARFFILLLTRRILVSWLGVVGFPPTLGAAHVCMQTRWRHTSTDGELSAVPAQEVRRV